MPDAKQVIKMHSQGHWKRFKTNIKKHPWKWLGGVVVAFFHGSIEHALYGWTNDRIANGATSLMPHFQDILAAGIAHPGLTLYILVASYGLLMIAIAYLSPLPTSLARSGDAGFSDSVMAISPSEIEAHVRVFHQPKTEFDGLLLKILNRGDYTVLSCRIAITSARSFNTRKGSFRLEPTVQGNAAEITHVRPDHPSAEVWLLRINKATQQLEIGDAVGRGAMAWPPGDPVQTQRWLLMIRLETTTVGPDSIRHSSTWEFPIQLDWTLPNTLKVKSATP